MVSSSLRLTCWTSLANMDPQNRVYNRKEVALFRKVSDPLGGLSNMAPGYPLCVNGMSIPTAEALYQALRFPHLPEVQLLVINQPGPVASKLKAAAHGRHTRSDWDTIRIRLVRWILRVKLFQHRQTFGELLLSTGRLPIVFASYQETFWGAKPLTNTTLMGTNALGRLLMELREELSGPQSSTAGAILPPDIDNFLLLGKPIGKIEPCRPAEET